MSARQYVGEAARVLDVAIYQQQQEHKVIAAFKKNYTPEASAIQKGIIPVSLFFSSKFHLWQDFHDIRAIRKIVRQEKINILHAHRGKDHIQACFANAPVLIRSRHVVTPIRNHFFNRRIYSTFTDGMICVSKAVEHVVRESLPKYNKPLVVIPGGAQSIPIVSESEVQTLRKNLNINNSSPILVCLARIAPVKGQHILLKSIPELLKKYPKLICIFAASRESESYRAELNNEINILGISNAVRWLGHLESIAPLMKIAAIGVIPSLGSEGWSRVAVEFLRSGVPVVASRVGSLAEIVQENVTGELVTPNDPTALSKALLKVIDDKRYAESVTERQPDFNKCFSAERVANDELLFYHRVMNIKGSRELRT